jgi:hypothetical protein
MKTKKANPKIEVIDEIRLRPEGFAELMLGLRPYQWQAEAIMPLDTVDGRHGRVNIAVCGPNGCGKDGVIIPSAAYYHLFYNPRGRVEITSKSIDQINLQTIPNLKEHYRKFGWPEPVGSPRFTLKTPTGGILTASVTDESARAEGSHGSPDKPLLKIINESASISADLYEGFDRCSPDALMNISKPWYKDYEDGTPNRFWDCVEGKLSHLYHVVRAGLKDCPHIAQEKIDFVIAAHGANHPIALSTLDGQFMERGFDEASFIPFDTLVACEYGEDELWETDITNCRILVGWLTER